MTLLELFQLLRKHLKLVILLPVLCAVAVGVGTLFMPDEYTAGTTIWVIPQSPDETSASKEDTSTDQVMLANDLTNIIQSGRVKSDVARELGLQSLDGFDVNVSHATSTRVITISVTGGDPQQAANVANAIAADVPQVTADVTQIESVNVIDEAQAPSAPSGPNRLRYVLVALAAGLFGAIVIVVLQDTLNTRIHSGEDVEELVDVPVIGHFQELGR